MSQGLRRPKGIYLAALVAFAVVSLLAAPVGPTAVSVVQAAQPDLTIVSDATYDVQPDKRRVRVTVDLTLVNHLKDTKTKRYYFDEAFIDVMPWGSAFKLTSAGSGTPTVKVTKRTDEYARLRLRFPRLYSGKTAKYRLTFDLADPGGKPTRDLRVGDSLVSFPLWAFASDATSGSSVTARFPAGYEVAVEAGSIPTPKVDADGRTIFRTGALASPLTFFAYLVADRPGAYQEETLSLEIRDRPASVTVRSWPDDQPWATRVGELVRGGLPALGELIGLDWPHLEPLAIQEAVSRSTGGYAGLFDPRRGLVDIAYYADDFVILHEAAHGWFNGALLADRWANEAFASYYATEVADDLGIKVRPDELTDELEAARIPLNAWGPVGREEMDREDYAYAASLALARAIAERAGDDGLRAVWSDAANEVGAYQPTDGAVEEVDGAPDWRGLLDLLEERTAADYGDLWRQWVVRPSDVALLDDRSVARGRLAEVTGQAEDWDLPRPIRDALRAWRFEDAGALLDAAASVLDARTRVETAAAAAGLIAPAGLRLAFEDDDGFEDAESEAAAELATIRAYEDAVATRPIGSDRIVELGLWGKDPEVDLVAASDALARGDLQASVARSADAEATWTSAEAVGQSRAISIGLLVLAGLLGVGLLVAAMLRWRRARRRRRQGWGSPAA